MNLFPVSFKEDGTLVLVGFGLMGRHMLEKALQAIRAKKVVVIDAVASAVINGTEQRLADVAAALPNPHGAEVEFRVADIADPRAMDEVFAGVKSINHLIVTSGISPKGLTPPEQIDRDVYLKAFAVNAFGPVNVISAAARAGSFNRGSRCVLILSTSATNGSEGRASAAYEMSKSALAGFLKFQAHYFLTEYGLVMNGISPAPLEGPMATGNPVGASRVKDVTANTPMGLNTPPNITAQTLFFLTQECNSAGQNIVTCGGYTLVRPVYGYLPGQEPVEPAIGTAT